MSQGRFSTPLLAPEDDWFVEPEAPRSAGREEPYEPRASTPGSREPGDSHQEPRRTRLPEGERDTRRLVAAIVGAALLVVVGVLVVRASMGSDGGGGTTTATLPTTATTTPATTTPTTTTPTKVTPTPATPTATTPAVLPDGVVLRRGDESGDVSQVQAALVELGYSTAGVDGKFGPATEKAVRDFQKASGLTEDGVVGPATLSALSAALNRP
jgi:cytoskeletal protein RodZ